MRWLRLQRQYSQTAIVDAGLSAALLPNIHIQNLSVLFPEIELAILQIFMVTRSSALSQPHLRAFFAHTNFSLRPCNALEQPRLTNK